MKVKVLCPQTPWACDVHTLLWLMAFSIGIFFAAMLVCFMVGATDNEIRRNRKIGVKYQLADQTIPVEIAGVIGWVATRCTERIERSSSRRKRNLNRERKAALKQMMTVWRSDLTPNQRQRMTQNVYNMDDWSDDETSPTASMSREYQAYQVGLRLLGDMEQPQPISVVEIVAADLLEGAESDSELEEDDEELETAFERRNRYRFSDSKKSQIPKNGWRCIILKCWQLRWANLIPSSCNVFFARWELT